MGLTTRMQYLRVVFVAVGASVISRLWAAADGQEPPPVIFFPPVDWPAFAITITFAALCCYGVFRFRIQGGNIVIPLIGGAVLQGFGLLKIELPTWILALSYALIGWSIGLRFTRSILEHAARALPRVSASIIILMALCGCMRNAYDNAVFWIDATASHVSISC